MEQVNLNKIDIGKLAKPIDTLIKKVAEAIGMIYEPTHIKRIAMAEGEAEKIKALSRIETQRLYTASDMEIREIQQKALVRFVNEETQKQINIDNILQKSFDEIKESATPEKMDDDWITNFFDKCKLVSDEQMQLLWSKVLAGEANHVGSYSKRTINLLTTLEKKDIEIFQALCSTKWLIKNHEVVLIYSDTDPIYRQNGINFDNLINLQELGLIALNSISNFSKIRLPKKNLTVYNGVVYAIEFDKEFDNNLNIGKVILTKTGTELSSLCKREYIPEFESYIMKVWLNMNIKIYSYYLKYLNKKEIEELGIFVIDQ